MTTPAIPVATPATPAVCPLCRSTRFTPVGRFDFGNWDGPTDADSAPASLTAPLSAALTGPLTGPLTAWSRQFDVGACVICGHTMIVTPYDSDLIARIYLETPQDDTYWGESLLGSRQPYRDMVDFCPPLPADGRIIDLGCGTGHLLDVLNTDYAVPDERLLGIDFNRRLPDGLPFLQADLTAIDRLPADGTRCSLAFAAHVLEHLPDPRRFLCAVAASLDDGGHLYVEVPDAANRTPGLVGPVNLVNQQHIHYFTAETLRRLAESSGFIQERAQATVSGDMPRLQMLLRRDSGGRTSAAAAVGNHLDRLRDKRRQAAQRILALLDRGCRVGLWGLGADFRRLLHENPTVTDRIARGDIALFDMAAAGRRYGDCPIASPSELAGFGGTVFMMPMLGDIRGRMRRYAQGRGLPAELLCDPYA